MRSGVVLGLAAALAVAPGLACAQLRGAIHPSGETTAPATAAASHPASGSASGSALAAQPAAAAPPIDPFLVFYPAAARAANLDGLAVIHCARNAHLAVVGCTLVSETPAGQGFGAAALAMAAQAKDNPKITEPDIVKAPAQDLTIHFTMKPPGIAPDLTRMAHIIANPEIVIQPTKAQIQAAYPTRALADQIEGGAAIDCVVTEQGKLAECRVAGESPSGYGFGEAALDLASDFSLKPGQLDNEPVGGRAVRISVAFTSNDPTAPLSLDAKPPP